MLIFLQHLVELHASCYPESWNPKDHFVSGQWIIPSIKDSERESRAANVLDQIKGSSQQRHSNWMAALKSASFKDSLISVLLKS